MSQRVDAGRKTLEEYRSIVGDDVAAAIEAQAEPLRGARVLHLNATAYGGGVAEILRTLVPLMRGMGLEAEWHVLSGSAEYYELTKGLHNALQGMEMDFTPMLRSLYLETLEANTEIFARDWDYVVVHDPQPAGIVGLLNGRRTGHWIWRCHIDTSTPSQSAVDFLMPYLSGYDVAVFTLPEYVTNGCEVDQIEYIHPSIDPLSPKNQALPKALAREILETRFGIDAERPLMTQVSRYDPWKDPMGVIDAYRAVRERVPDAQLALVGNMADDDPEGLEYHQLTLEHAGEDPDIHVLSTLDRLSRDDLTHSLEINAFQSGSDVVVQKSTREGFGLVVAEAMWKRSPVVGGRAGGIIEQIEDGVTGFLVSDSDECADRVVDLMEDQRLQRDMGNRARESVKQRFLTPRHLADYYRVFASVTNGGSGTSEDAKG